MSLTAITSKEGLEFLDSFKPSTMRTYRSALGKFLKFYRKAKYGKSLTDFLDALETDKKKPRRERERIDRKILKEFVRYLLDDGHAPKSIGTYIGAIQSFGKYFDVAISTKYITLPSNQPVSKKHPWVIQEVDSFITTLEGLEIQSISSTIFQSGLSIGDALAITYDDIMTEYEKEVSPLCLDFTRKKTDTPFMTFIGKYAIDKLKQHLGKTRVIERYDPIYTLSARTVEKNFETLARTLLGEYKGSNPMRPHSLRAAFNSFLADDGLPQDDREFFMGHNVPEQRHVYISRSREKWRELYAKHEGALTP